MYVTSLNYSDWRVDHRPARGPAGRPAGRGEIDLRVASIRRRGRVER
jgi:hypothetical protein